MFTCKWKNPFLVWIKVAMEVQGVLFWGTCKEKTEMHGANHMNTFSFEFQKIQMQMRIKTSSLIHFFFLFLVLLLKVFSRFGKWGLLLAIAHGLPPAVASLLRSTGSGVQAQWLWHMGFVVPRHVGSYRTRNQTRVPCIGRWILFFFFFTLY